MNKSLQPTEQPESFSPETSKSRTCSDSLRQPLSGLRCFVISVLTRTGMRHVKTYEQELELLGENLFPAKATPPD